MPHLPDGTPVELAYSFLGLHTRLNVGQMREAVMSRIARAEGVPAIVPPFHAPDEKELRSRLAAAGLDESGMKTLTLGRDGPKLARPSTVGWIYWARLHHLVLEKVHASVGTKSCQLQAENEYYELRDMGAFETIAETYNTRCVHRKDAETLAAQVAAGPVEQAGPPSPKFVELSRRLNMAGIRAELDGRRLTFAFAPPAGETLDLACPVTHPCLPERRIEKVGVFDVSPQYPALVEANRRMQSLLAGQAPASLRDSAAKQLAEHLADWMDALLGAHDSVWTRNPGPVAFGNHVLFSGRSVISPGGDLRIDQVGVAEDIAWTLFGPLLAREIGGEADVQNRTPAAAEALDEIMARSWVILNRAPTMMPTSLLAFHPVRIPDKVIRLHPLACRPMNADFDGDQAAVFLPVTEAGQREASELLSVVSHLRRDPELLPWLVPTNDVVWGLASLSLTRAGRQEIADLAGVEVATPDGFVTRHTLVEALGVVLGRSGPEETLEVLERLVRRGFDETTRSGASLSPFCGNTLDRPPAPDGDDLAAWAAHAEQVAERIVSRSDYDNADFGPQLLAVKSGARGAVAHLACLLGPRVVAPPDAPWQAAGEFENIPFVCRHGWVHGVTPEEMYSCAVGARIGLGMTAYGLAETGYEYRRTRRPRGFNVLARAMRADRPGIVFAQAAATGEIDPLTDLDTRLFVGLPARE